MKRVVVQYKVKPDQVAKNEELVRAVYEELDRAQPEGLRYGTFRLEDGVSFVHLHEREGEENALSELEAFKQFQEAIGERCDEPPAVTELTEIGTYRLFGG